MVAFSEKSLRETANTGTTPTTPSTNPGTIPTPTEAFTNAEQMLPSPTNGSDAQSPTHTDKQKAAAGKNADYDKRTARRSAAEKEETGDVAPKHGMFAYADADEMKQRVRDAKFKKDPYNVYDFYHETGLWQCIAKNTYFENTTLAVISGNAVWIAIDTDYNTADSFLNASLLFKIADGFFCVYFTAELVIRFLAFKRKFNCLKDGWFKFDTVLVGLMLMETVLFTIISVIKGDGGGSPLGNTAILRLFRLLRLSRLLRMLRSLPELMILIKGMMTAMTSVVYVMGLLMIVTYVFAIAFTQLSDGTDFREVYFAHVGLSMYSLLVYGTFLDALSDFLNDIRAESPVCLALAVLFISLSSLTVLNMLIGVLCEVISAVACEEKEGIMVETVNCKFSEIVKELDSDGNGKISVTEFNQILNMPKALDALEYIGVDAIGLVDFAEHFFLEDGEWVEIDFEKFMSMLLDLRGSQGATVKDIMNLNLKMNQKHASVQKENADLKTRMIRIEDKLDKLLLGIKPIAASPTELA